MVVVLVEVVFQNFDLIVIFSGRVGGAQAWEEAGEKEKEARMEDGREEWEQASLS